MQGDRLTPLLICFLIWKHLFTCCLFLSGRGWIATLIYRCHMSFLWLGFIVWSARLSQFTHLFQWEKLSDVVQRTFSSVFRWSRYLLSFLTAKSKGTAWLCSAQRWFCVCENWPLLGFHSVLRYPHGLERGRIDSWGLRPQGVCTFRMADNFSMCNQSFQVLYDWTALSGFQIIYLSLSKSFVCQVSLEVYRDSNTIKM